MTTPTTYRLLALPAVLALGACAYTAEPTGTAPVIPDNASGDCTAGPAQGMVGQPATAQAGAEIMQRTGARTLRWGPPDSAFTMDFRQDRVNIIYDRAMVITQITCG